MHHLMKEPKLWMFYLLRSIKKIVDERNRIMFIKTDIYTQYAIGILKKLKPRR